jgi:hypothetical protein
MVYDNCGNVSGRARGINMPRRPALRQCLRCGLVNPGADRECGDCHAPLVKKRWQMTSARIRRIHAVALRQKGLTRELYEMNLEAVGVASCKDMKQKHYGEFMKRMRRLPDVHHG